MLKLQVLDTIKKNRLIDYGDGIVVGISGGYDSVCLLHILYSMADDFSLELYPVHINHMLRGEEAMRDENFVRSFCSSLGLEVHVERIDIARKASLEKTSLEEAGRNARYQVFKKVLADNAAKKIAVAHSKNDQVETLLMRIFRGTGPEGLKGIEYIRDNIIRPLLDADRSQIEEYVKNNGLEAITDSSNLHTDYFRNRIRLKVIPEINSAVGKDITENLLKLSKIVVADEEYLRYNSELYYQKALSAREKAFVQLDLKELSHLHQAVLSRVLRRAFTDITGSITGLEYVHVDKLIQLILSGRTGARLDLPLGYMAVKSYGTIVIQKQGQIKSEKYEYVLRLSCDVQFETLNCIIRSEIFNGNKEQSDYYLDNYLNEKTGKIIKLFDFDKIQNKLNEDHNSQLVVRNRRDGDIFKPHNSRGTKKLKEYFIDNKIPKDQRDSFPLIAINKEIIWIIGNKTSDKYKVTDNTNSVLMINFESINKIKTGY